MNLNGCFPNSTKRRFENLAAQAKRADFQRTGEIFYLARLAQIFQMRVFPENSKTAAHVEPGDHFARAGDFVQRVVFGEPRPFVELLRESEGDASGVSGGSFDAHERAVSKARVDLLETIAPSSRPPPALKIS